MTKKIIAVLIAIIFFSTSFLSVSAFEINLTKKINFYDVNEPLIPIPGDMKEEQLPFNSGFESPRKIYIPNVEPIRIDANIVSLIENLNEDVILEFLENLTSFGPRFTDTEACDKSGDYIYNEFIDMGLDARYHYWNNDNDLSGTNIEATINGYDDTIDEVY